MSGSESYWWYITLRAPSGREDILTSLAESSGSIGSEERDHIGFSTLRAYFRSTHDLGYWLDRLSKIVESWPDVSISDMGKIENRQWHTDWMDAFPPLKVGERLVVLAPWHRGKEPEDRIPLYIYPGSAFGTGYHESTQNVLCLMEKYLEEGAVVADIGSGSGILSIAAIKLGARNVYARDLDPAVLSEAFRNIGLNELDEGMISVKEGDLLKGFDHKVDMLVSNILIEPLTAMVSDVPRVLKQEGVALFSGIISKEREGFLKVLEDAGMEVVDEVRSEDWCGIAARLKQ